MSDTERVRAWRRSPNGHTDEDRLGWRNAGDDTEAAAAEERGRSLFTLSLPETKQRVVLDTYERWIAATVRGNLRGRCAVWTRRMQQTFPELRRVGGIVAPADRPPYAGGHLVQHHWWLLTPAGQVVDPTARQFGWPLVYIEFGDEATLMRACTAWDEFVRLLHTAVPSPEPTPASVRCAPAAIERLDVTQARIETLLARMIPTGENGRDA